MEMLWDDSDKFIVDFVKVNNLIKIKAELVSKTVGADPRSDTELVSR